jgi:hypothetical protein
VIALLLALLAEWHVVVPLVLSSKSVPVAKVLFAFVVSAVKDANVPAPPPMTASTPTASSTFRYVVDAKLRRSISPNSFRRCSPDRL